MSIEEFIASFAYKLEEFPHFIVDRRIEKYCTSILFDTFIIVGYFVSFY